MPALQKTEGGGLHEVRSSRAAWLTWKNPTSIKNTKISQVWWYTPIVSATWESEAAESLESGRQIAGSRDCATTFHTPGWATE